MGGNMHGLFFQACKCDMEESSNIFCHGRFNLLYLIFKIVYLINQ